MRLGLALGAGGIVGASWEVGALEGIRRATGFTPPRADLVIGTSAGAFIGALAFTAGLELTYHQVSGDAVPGVSFTAADLELARRMDAHNAGRLLQRFPFARLPRPFLASLAGLKRAWRGERGLFLAAASLLWEGPLSSHRLGAIVGEAWPSGWPDPRLHLATFDLASATTCLLSADSAIDVAGAVTAAVAIPGVFAPVRHAGRRLADGSVWSAVHLDQFLGRGLDAVVCVHPLASETTSASSRRRGLFGFLRRRLRERVLADLERGRRALEAEGTSVLVLGPTREERSAMPRNPMDLASRPRIVRDAASATEARLLRPENAELVRVLVTAAARGRSAA